MNKRLYTWERVYEGDMVTVVYTRHEGVTKSARGRVHKIARRGSRVYMTTREGGVITWFDVNDAPRFLIESSAPVNPEPMFEMV